MPVRTAFLITLLFCTITLSGGFSSAQDGANTPAAQSEGQPQAEKSIYANATDANIKEAQKYYKHCQQNKTLSTRKDCKCAAAAYLETRLRMGEKAEPRDILKANTNRCLSEKSPAPLGNAPDFSNVTDEQLAEAENVYKKCEKDGRINIEIDCECRAARFLDVRLEKGPVPSESEILVDIQYECRDVVAMTGYEYQQCMSGDPNRVPNNIDLTDFCTCVGTYWGKRVEAFTGKLTYNVKKNIKLSAALYCGNPENYL